MPRYLPLYNQSFSDGKHPQHNGWPSPIVSHAVGPGPSLAAHANRAINGLPMHAVGRHLLSVVQAGTDD